MIHPQHQELSSSELAHCQVSQTSSKIGFQQLNWLGRTRKLSGTPEMNALDVARWLQLEKYSLVRSKLQISKSGRTSNEKSKEREIAVADGPIEERATIRSMQEIDRVEASKPGKSDYGESKSNKKEGKLSSR